MDGRRLDALSRALTDVGTRRGLLGFLATLPVAGGLFAVVDLEDVDAKGRRKRRKKRHKHGKGRRRKHPATCRPQPKATTCAGGTCGLVVNNCKKTVDCGSCNCPRPCDPCFICQSGPNTPGSCVVDPDTIGEPCGSAGQHCQANGACACDVTSCVNPAPICADGKCVPCSSALTCPAGCCDAKGACQVGDTTTACGNAGAECATCIVFGEVCSAGACGCPSQVICSASGCCPTSADVCDANDQCCTQVDPCTGSACGVVTNNCGQSITCDPCPVIASFATTPDTIDGGAIPPETATLNWSTSNATTCTVDDGSGPVGVNCNDSLLVGPATTTTYTLTASNATDAEDSAQVTVTVQYCHSITSPGSTCTTGNMEFCLSEPIDGSNPAHAVAACDACYGAGLCTNNSGTCGGGGRLRDSGDQMFVYWSGRAGKIMIPYLCEDTGARWAP